MRASKIARTVAVVALAALLPCFKASANDGLDAQAAVIAKEQPAAVATKLPKLTLSDRLPLIQNGWDALAAVADVTTVNGVYSFSMDGESGPGVAALISIWHLDTPDGGMRFMFGPSYTTMLARQGDRQAIGLGVTTKVLDGAAIQVFIEKVPVLGQIVKALKVDVTNIYGFGSAGLRLDSDTSKLEQGITLTIGGGGIGFGRGK